MSWWRSLDRGARIGLMIVAVGALLGIAGGISAAVGKSSPHQAARKGHSPMSCLLLQGLTGISDRGGGTWRGSHQTPFFSVFIDQLSTPADARAAVKAATAVHAVQAGIYMVSGPGKAVDDQGTVEGVASCLTG